MMLKRYLTLFSTIIVLLAGCTKPVETMAAPSKKMVSVNVHGVNYTGDPFRYVVVDASDPSNRGGGEHIGPFSGGGTVCCYTLPRKWKPGLKVNVNSTHWLKEDENGKLPEVNKTYKVEIPQYPEGEVGELWVLRTAGGDIEVVVSNVEPGHAQWPGKVKGWPEPSLEYKRERWEIFRKDAENKVTLYQSSLDELNSGKKNDWNETWELDKQYFSDEVKGFSGPDDAKYVEYKKQQYIKGLKRSRERLDELIKGKP